MDELRRTDTVGNAFRYFASVVVVLVAGMLILNELGISIAPILATAGVAGIAIAFGAQSLIKDYFTGFFLLIEESDHARARGRDCGKSSEVEEVTLRSVRLRDNDGFVHFVLNGEIKLATNRTRGSGQAGGMGHQEQPERRGRLSRPCEMLADAAGRVRPRRNSATCRSPASSAGSISACSCAAA